MTLPGLMCAGERASQHECADGKALHLPDLPLPVSWALSPKSTPCAPKLGRCASDSENWCRAVAPRHADCSTIEDVTYKACEFVLCKLLISSFALSSFCACAQMANNMPLGQAPRNACRIVLGVNRRKALGRIQNMDACDPAECATMTSLVLFVRPHPSYQLPPR